MMQQDNYALTILTQAAMQTNTNNNSNTPNSISSATGSIPPSNNHSRALTTTRDAGYHSHVTPTTATSISSSTISNHPTDISQYHLAPSVSSLVGDYSRPHRAMETLVFNPTEQISQSAYMNHPFHPTYPSSLGILSAEKYDDGRSSMGSHNPSMMSKGQMHNPIPFGMLEKSGDSSDTRLPSEDQEQEHGKKRRKRVRNESLSLEDDDEARKKARGRPRVDTKDENAADVSSLKSLYQVPVAKSPVYTRGISEQNPNLICSPNLKILVDITHNANYCQEAKNSNSNGSKSLPTSQRDNDFFSREASSRASRLK
ncbi:hypothetical protein NHQ30_010531 [Ciborinia camelliae]|nr:hypothetical protein NHQ30_010531 [Ciborinia camelliae]